MSEKIAGLDELNNAPSEPAAGEAESVSLDSLHSIAVDNAQVNDTLQRGLLPAGSYLTDPENYGELNALVQKLDEEGGTSRLVITLTGRGRAKVSSNGSEPKLVEGRIRAQLSPDARLKRVFGTDELLESMDIKTTLYAQAVKAYEQQFKEKPKTVGALVDYLTKYPVKFRIIQVGVPTKNNLEPDGEPRNFCMGIYAAR